MFSDSGLKCWITLPDAPHVAGLRFRHFMGESDYPHAVMVLEGMTEAALGVDAENPSGAIELYEKTGFQIEKRIAFYRKRMN